MNDSKSWFCVFPVRRLLTSEEAAGSRWIYEILVGMTDLVMRAEVGGNWFRLTCAGLAAGIVYASVRA